MQSNEGAEPGGIGAQVAHGPSEEGGASQAEPQPSNTNTSFPNTSHDFPVKTNMCHQTHAG